MGIRAASVALTGGCAAMFLTVAPPVSANPTYVVSPMSSATHHDPCKKRQVDVYYSNPTHLLGAGKVHGSGHGAKLHYVRDGDIEKLTYKPVKHYRLKKVRVALYNISSGKTKTKHLKTTSRSYSYGDSEGYISYFDVCAAKS